MFMQAISYVYSYLSMAVYIKNTIYYLSMAVYIKNTIYASIIRIWRRQNWLIDKAYLHCIYNVT